MMNVLQQRINTMDMLRSAAEGTRDAYVWRSPQFPGADMKMSFRWPGIVPDPHEHGLPEEFVQAVELTSAVKLSQEEAAQKLAGMRVAATSIEDMGV